jgi:hypothetical protein
VGGKKYQFIMGWAVSLLRHPDCKRVGYEIRRADNGCEVVRGGFKGGVAFLS